METTSDQLPVTSPCVSDGFSTTAGEDTSTVFIFPDPAGRGLAEPREAHAIPWAILSILTFVATIFGNVALVYIITCTSALRTVTNGMVASMAVADFLMGCFVMPFCAVSFLLNRWAFGPVYCQFVGFCYSFCSTARIMNILIVSVDRWVAVTWPLKYTVNITPPVAACMVGYVWLHSCVFSAPPLFGWGSYRYRHHGGLCTFDWTSNWHYLVCKYVACWAIPFSLTFVIFIRIARTASSQRRVFTAMPVAVGMVLAISPNPQVTYRRSTIYAMKTLFFIVLVTIVMCLPRVLVEASVYQRRYAEGMRDLLLHAYGACSWLALSSSAVNPIIFLTNKKFKKIFKETFCKCVKLKANADSSVADMALPAQTLTTGSETPQVVPRVSRSVSVSKPAGRNHDSNHQAPSSSRQARTPLPLHQNT